MTSLNVARVSGAPNHTLNLAHNLAHNPLLAIACEVSIFAEMGEWCGTPLKSRRATGRTKPAAAETD